MARMSIMRAAAIGACLLGAGALCFYSQSVGPRQVDTISELLAFPDRSAEKQIRLVSNVKVYAVYPESIDLVEDNARVTAFLSPALRERWRRERSSVKPDDFISLQATFKASGYLILEDYHIHKGRRLKIWLSAFTVVLTFAFLGYQWRREAVDA